jgi:hypothetical protein
MMMTKKPFFLSKTLTQKQTKGMQLYTNGKNKKAKISDEKKLKMIIWERKKNIFAQKEMQHKKKR